MVRSSTPEAKLAVELILSMTQHQRLAAMESTFVPLTLKSAALTTPSPTHKLAVPTKIPPITHAVPPTLPPPTNAVNLVLLPDPLALLAVKPRAECPIPSIQRNKPAVPTATLFLEVDHQPLAVKPLTSNKPPTTPPSANAAAESFVTSLDSLQSHPVAAVARPSTPPLTSAVEIISSSSRTLPLLLVVARQPTTLLAAIPAVRIQSSTSPLTQPAALIPPTASSRWSLALVPPAAAPPRPREPVTRAVALSSSIRAPTPAVLTKSSQAMLAVVARATTVP